MDHDLTIALRSRIAHIVAYRFTLENERHRNMSRLSEKLALAGGVVERVSARIEAKADAVIAREPVIDRKTEETFAGHDAHLDDAMDALDALEQKLRLMSNAPLESSGTSQEGATAPITTERVALGPHPDQPEVAEKASQTFRAAE